jgi:hypothetical protein
MKRRGKNALRTNGFQLRTDKRCANCSAIAMRPALFVATVCLLAASAGAAEAWAQKAEPLAQGNEPMAQNNLKLIQAYLAADKQHPPSTRFDPEIPKITVFWKSAGLEVGDRIRVVWVAEDVGEANPKETKINEKTVMTLKRSEEGSLFLARPGGRTWPVGKYRVDFFINNKFAQAVKFVIGQGPSVDVKH